MQLEQRYRLPSSARMPAAACYEDCLWERPVHPPLPLAAKSLFDCLAALAAIVVAAPVMGLLAVLVRCTSPGPAIYSQLRIGYQGKLFYLYKFRSMYHDCEKNTGPVWTSQNDSRVTPLGKILRMTYLDELPQLFNVLSGQMSLVGPRPERPEITAQFRREFPRDYYQRLSVKPGITGLAQVRQPADLDVDDVRRKLHYDLLYVRRMSLWLDLKLIVGTITCIVWRSQEAQHRRRRPRTQRPIDDAPRSAIERQSRINGEQLTPLADPIMAG